MKKIIYIGGFLLLIPVAFIAYVAIGFARAEVGEMQQISHTAELNADAEVVEANIRMMAGNLTLHSGADALVASEFTFNVDTWKPEVTHETIGGIGRLTITQPDNAGINARNVHNEWQIAFNDDVPLRLDVQIGAGNADMYIGDLSLDYLHVEIGAGNKKIDLRGDSSRNLQASIAGGTGNITLIVPDDVRAEVTIQDNIGSVSASGFSMRGNTYTSEYSTESDRHISVFIQNGIGNVTLQRASSSIDNS